MNRSVTAFEDPVARSPWPVWLIRWTHFEFWPMWFFYLPVMFYWLYSMIRTGKPLYFTAANPAIELGGFFGESKSAILHQVPERYRPAMLAVAAQTPADAVSQLLNSGNLQFPLVIKPDTGERGDGVLIVHTLSALLHYANTAELDYIIQEFAGQPVELGILYYRFPDGSRSGITSITQKIFMAVTGDGRSTVHALLHSNKRYRMQLPRLQRERPEVLNEVPAAGAYRVVEPVGNHCRGTIFLNGNHLINDALVRVFDEITSAMDGFYFGRFDIKVSSLDDLYRGTGIRILELNGTTSEPAHIYDPHASLIGAYRDVCANMKLVRQIAQQNMRRGIRCTPATEFLTTVRNHFRRQPPPQIISV